MSNKQSQLPDKITALEEYWKEHGDDKYLDDIKSWRQSVKDNMAISELKNHHGFKLLIKGFKDLRRGINYNLKEDEKMSEIDRAKSFQGKYVINYFLSFFEDAESAVKEIEQNIDDNLEEFK